MHEQRAFEKQSMEIKRGDGFSAQYAPAREETDMHQQNREKQRTWYFAIP